MTKAFLSKPMGIRPEWIDFNNHLNMAYYGVLFDHGLDEVFDDFGITQDYITTRKLTTYAAELRIRYLRELHLDAKVRVSFQILDMTDKSLHYFSELWHEDGWLSATAEGVSLHIDQSGPRVAPYPSEVHAKIAAMYEAHKDLPRPPSVDTPMTLRRKKS
ncbi:thioesterase family protein [Litorivita sp. NS0012-18]|uniref:acyl-CoA thioesterase n=1 Tax=Litorivita sp. NS0012-18 TaxID=3127655 RepID=UPI003102C1D4